MINEVPFAQRQRLQFIESIVFWEGAIDRPRVARIFGVTENHVTKDFSLYRERYPENLDYDLSQRSYKPGKKFRQQFSSGLAEEYLSLLRASQEGVGVGIAPSISEGINAEILPTPSGKIDSSILKEVTRALHRGSGLKISYQSLKTATKTEREIWPHALVYASNRWHIRAFDSKYGNFIDLVLQRILSVKTINHVAPKKANEDVLWNNRVQITLVPRAELPEPQQNVIALEFGMEKVDGQWIWRNSIRECLVAYFFDSMSLTKPIAHLHPKLSLVESHMLDSHCFSVITDEL